MLKAGDHIGAWTVVNVDPAGAQCVCLCRCGATRILAVGALVDGTAAPSCGCQPLSRKQKRAQREGFAEDQRRQSIRDWKPGR
jgi:hypothetical protein